MVNVLADDTLEDRKCIDAIAVFDQLGPLLLGSQIRVRVCYDNAESLE